MRSADRGSATAPRPVLAVGPWSPDMDKWFRFFWTVLVTCLVLRLYFVYWRHSVRVPLLGTRFLLLCTTTERVALLCTTTMYY